MYLGCLMFCFQTKNTNLGKFWRVLRWNMLVYFKSIYVVYFMAISQYFTALCYNLWLFGIYFPVLVSCSKTNLATLVCTTKNSLNSRIFNKRSLCNLVQLN
jgi:hypothetical protein